jgi:hypothetical protein
VEETTVACRDQYFSITTLLGFSPRQLRFDIRCTNYKAIICAAQDFFEGVAKNQNCTNFVPPALRTMCER